MSYIHRGPTVRADSEWAPDAVKALLAKHCGPQAVVFSGGEYPHFPEALAQALSGLEKPSADAPAKAKKKGGK